MKNRPNHAFTCIDGSIIHFANVDTILMARYEGIDFINVNGHRIINDKHNKKLMSLIFPFSISIGKKIEFKISEFIKNDFD